MARGRTWTDDELVEAVRRSASTSGVLRELGLRAAGGNHANVGRHIERLGLDTSHFESARPPRRPVTPLADVLVRGSSYSRAHLKKRLYDDGLKTPCCELCGQGETWRGKRMSLILDHINGEHDDNRLENLRIVCPNCNATLDTHCGRHNRRAPAQRACDHCGGTFRPNSRKQRFCDRRCSARGRDLPKRRPWQDKVQRPAEDVLRAELEATSFRAVGRKYGVSDNAVRKWLRFYERERV